MRNRDLAIKTVDGIIGDIESAVKRGAAVFGEDELLTSLIPSFLGVGGGIEIKPQAGRVYTGERRNLTILLDCKNWIDTFHYLNRFRVVDELLKQGDYIRLPIKANAGSFGGLEFAALDIPETELVVTDVTPNKINLNFEEALFFSAVNEKNTNKGGLKESALGKYLNTQFLDALDPVKECLAKNKDGLKVTLPTLYEVAADDDFGKDMNWEDEPRQLEYFKKIKNRIRTYDNDTKWWWLYNAANASGFASVNNYGYANLNYASITSGGVAPAICIIRPPAP